MKIKSGLMALGAMATLLLVSGNTTEAKSVNTNKNDETTTVKVKAGDTLSSIAKEHNTTYVRLFNANKDIANPDIVDVGDEVKIPKNDEKLNDRFNKLQSEAMTVQVSQIPATYQYTPQQTSAVPSAQSYSTYRGSSAGNTYAWGNCTWYVKNRRGDLPNMLGNGGSWSASAAAQGYKTGSTPRAGAVAEESGHVAYVESVNKNGTVNISEMNYGGAVGKVHKRTVSASEFRYIY